MPTISRLAGRSCAACDQATLQPGDHCAYGCGRTMVDAAFSASGTVYASTVIRVPAPNLPNPYQVGYVDLPEGVRIFGHFATTEPVAPGRAVRVQVHDRPEVPGPFVRHRFLLDGSDDGEVNHGG